MVCVSPCSFAVVGNAWLKLVKTLAENINASGIFFCKLKYHKNADRSKQTKIDGEAV